VAAEKFGATETTIYEWRRAIERRGERTGESLSADGHDDTDREDPKETRDRKILSMWRQHPGYGPSQVRNMLKRDGFKVSVGTVRDVMERGGYLPPNLRRKEPAGRYEAARPRELYHLDFYHFHVHKQKQCVLFVEDDFSRFIAGWTMAPVEAADPVIACFEQSVQRYGRPEGVMSDRGSAFHSWRGLSRFEALLEEYEINYFLAKEAAVNGKVEALNASFQKECVEQIEFMDLTDAARGIGRWVEHYNHRRTHHGLGGLLVPADRFYGIAEQSLRRIEQGLGAQTAELSSPDGRALELFRVLSRGGKPEIWLMGEKVLG
jgi:transposase InsO family protein